MTPALRNAWWLVGTLWSAVLLWFVWSGRVEVGPPPPIPVPTMVVVAPAAADASVASEPIAPETPPAHGEDEIELCGGLWVKAKADGSIDDDDFKRVVRLPEARAHMLDALRAESSEFARAAAIRLALIGSEPPPLPEGATTCEPAQCEAQRQYAARLAEARDALAQMATTTRDPRVYALAFNNCRLSQPGEGACQLLSAEQWARLDPGNAAPWTFVLGQAVDRRDVPAQSEALHRIATSTRSELHWSALSGLVLDRMPGDDASAPAALTLAVETMGVEAAFTHPGFQLVSKVCKGAPLRDSNRREECAAAAELLAERSDTLFEQGIGAQIGAQVGWPAERLQKLRAESAAYVDSLTGPKAFAQTDSCSEIHRDLKSVRLRARLGEVGALREWVAQSGKRPEDFIEAEREAQATRAVAAASASAAASAASAAR